MKIEEAIELLEEELSDCSEDEVPQWMGALSLGIEALKQLALKRQEKWPRYTILLPGETE